MVDCFGSAKSLLKTEKKIQIYLKTWQGPDNRYLLPKSKLFRNQAASPFLQSARGFKTRYVKSKPGSICHKFDSRRNTEESSGAFSRSKKSSSEESDPDSKSQVHSKRLFQILEKPFIFDRSQVLFTIFLYDFPV